VVWCSLFAGAVAENSEGGKCKVCMRVELPYPLVARLNHNSKRKTNKPPVVPNRMTKKDLPFPTTPHLEPTTFPFSYTTTTKKNRKLARTGIRTQASPNLQIWELQLPESGPVSFRRQPRHLLKRSVLSLHYPGILIGGEGVIGNDEGCRKGVNGQEEIESGQVTSKVCSMRRALA
jgi:hypothetical protein